MPAAQIAALSLASPTWYPQLSSTGASSHSDVTCTAAHTTYQGTSHRDTNPACCTWPRSAWDLCVSLHDPITLTLVDPYTQHQYYVDKRTRYVPQMEVSAPQPQWPKSLRLKLGSTCISGRVGAQHLGGTVTLRSHLECTFSPLQELL